MRLKVLHTLLWLYTFAEASNVEQNDIIEVLTGVTSWMNSRRKFSIIAVDAAGRMCVMSEFTPVLRGGLNTYGAEHCGVTASSADGQYFSLRETRKFSVTSDPETLDSDNDMWLIASFTSYETVEPGQPKQSFEWGAGEAMSISYGIRSVTTVGSQVDTVEFRRRVLWKVVAGLVAPYAGVQGVPQVSFVSQYDETCLAPLANSSEVYCTFDVSDLATVHILNGGGAVVMSSLSLNAQPIVFFSDAQKAQARPFPTTFTDAGTVLYTAPHVSHDTTNNNKFTKNLFLRVQGDANINITITKDDGATCVLQSSISGTTSLNYSDVWTYCAGWGPEAQFFEGVASVEIEPSSSVLVEEMFFEEGFRRLNLAERLSKSEQTWCDAGVVTAFIFHSFLEVRVTSGTLFGSKSDARFTVRFKSTKGEWCSDLTVDAPRPGRISYYVNCPFITSTLSEVVISAQDAANVDKWFVTELEVYFDNFFEDFRYFGKYITFYTHRSDGIDARSSWVIDEGVSWFRPTVLHSYSEYSEFADKIDHYSENVKFFEGFGGIERSEQFENEFFLQRIASAKGGDAAGRTREQIKIYTGTSTSMATVVAFSVSLIPHDGSAPACLLQVLVPLSSYQTFSFPNNCTFSLSDAASIKITSLATVTQAVSLEGEDGSWFIEELKVFERFVFEDQSEGFKWSSWKLEGQQEQQGWVAASNAQLSGGSMLEWERSWRTSMELRIVPAAFDVATALKISIRAKTGHMCAFNPIALEVTTSPDNANTNLLKVQTVCGFSLYEADSISIETNQKNWRLVSAALSMSFVGGTAEVLLLPYDVPPSGAAISLPLRTLALPNVPQSGESFDVKVQLSMVQQVPLRLTLAPFAGSQFASCELYPLPLNQVSETVFLVYLNTTERCGFPADAVQRIVVSTEAGGAVEVTEIAEFAPLLKTWQKWGDVAESFRENSFIDVDPATATPSTVSFGRKDVVHIRFSTSSGYYDWSTSTFAVTVRSVHNEVCSGVVAAPYRDDVYAALVCGFYSFSVASVMLATDEGDSWVLNGVGVLAYPPLTWAEVLPASGIREVEVNETHSSTWLAATTQQDPNLRIVHSTPVVFALSSKTPETSTPTSSTPLSTTLATQAPQTQTEAQTETPTETDPTAQPELNVTAAPPSPIPSETPTTTAMPATPTPTLTPAPQGAGSGSGGANDNNNDASSGSGGGLSTIKILIVCIACCLLCLCVATVVILCVNARKKKRFGKTTTTREWNGVDLDDMGNDTMLLEDYQMLAPQSADAEGIMLQDRDEVQISTVQSNVFTINATEHEGTDASRYISALDSISGNTGRQVSGAGYLL